MYNTPKQYGVLEKTTVLLEAEYFRVMLCECDCGHLIFFNLLQSIVMSCA